MFRMDDEDEEWNEEDDQPQGYQALLDPEDQEEEEEEEEEETMLNEHEEENEEVESVKSEEELPIDDAQIKPFTCQLCSVSFSKFEGYREHFISTEHRYKRRDEKRRLGENSIIDSSPVEIFVNLLLYNKIPFECVHIDIQTIDFSYNGLLEYNNTKYEHQHAPSINDLYQTIVQQFNQDHMKHQLKMPPQSFFVARDISRKEIDHIWTVSRYCDDTDKSDEQIIKEVLDYCVYANVEPERERMIGHSIQTWRMFHRQETKAGFWCDICKQCFRKRKAIISHFETSEKHENNLKRLPPYRRAVQHSLFTGRLLNEFIPIEKLNYYRARVNAYRIPPSNRNLKNAFYCTFCKKSFESAYSLEKHLGWKGHRDILRKRRQQDLDNLPRLVTYFNFNQLTHEQKNGGIQQMVKEPDEYRLRYNLEPFTIESIHDDIMRFDTRLAQQVMQSMHNHPPGNNNNRFDRTSGGGGGGGGRGRGRGRGRQTFRGQTRGNYYQPGQFNPSNNYQPRPFNNRPCNQLYQQNNFHLPTNFRPRNPNFGNGNNKRPYPQNHSNNYSNQWQAWPNKRPRFDSPSSHQQSPMLYQQPSSSSSSNRIDYRYVANQNTYQQQQQQYYQ